MLKSQVGFSPEKFALGFLGGAVGSKAVSQGFKVIKDNPQIKESLKQELANTLAKGWEASVDKYPILKVLEPMRIVQSEKARIAQAGYLLNKIEKQNLEHTKQGIIKDLDNLIAENIPQELSKEEFLTKGLSEVINKENFVKHLSNSQDSFMRLKYLNLVEPTKQRANIEFTQGERKGYIKAFKDKNKNLFYVLITEDKDKLLITGIPTNKKREVIRQIKKADFITRRMDSIDTLSPTAKATAEAENVSTSQSNSSTDTKLLSKAQSKFNYDEKKASDLLEWHKDSSPITKDKDGLPKVFYHGSKVKGLEEFKSEFDESGLGFWFSSYPSYSKHYENSYKTFVNIKNPLDLRGSNPKYDFELEGELRKKGLSYEPYRQTSPQTKEFLKSKGYDSIIIDGDDGYFLVVFDSNQIKHIDNKGSYTDINGNITSTKPKDTQAEHRYFNEASPNIYQSNPHIGSGLVSGTLAGVETDEQGNIIGFDPAKFALGFLGGAVGSKGIATIYKHKSAQEYALNSIKSIQENYKELSQQNPVLFAKILSNINPRNFLKSKKEVKALSEEVFNKELKAKIQESIAKQEVEPMPQSAFKNLDEFENLFDEIRANKGIIKTPYKDVEVNVKYAFRHFTKNTYNTDRNNIKGGFFATFKNPLFVVEQTREGSHKPSVYFYKPFYDENKKLLNLFGISVDNKGKLDFKTYYLDSAGNRLKSILNDKDLVIRYVKE